MASKTEDKLLRELELHRAMVLDKYPSPLPLDRKAALDTTKDRTRFDQPQVHAWTIDERTNVPVFGWFNKARDSFGKSGKDMLERAWFDSPVLALIASRNDTSHVCAGKLLALDKEIAKHLAGSGILPGVIVSKADMPIETTEALHPFIARAMTPEEQAVWDELDADPIVPAAEGVETPPVKLDHPIKTKPKTSPAKAAGNAVRKAAAKTKTAQVAKPKKGAAR